MKIEREITEDEVIAAFLEAELSSTRWSQAVKKVADDLQICVNEIRGPDISDPLQNHNRRKVLERQRGFGVDNLLFEKFPSDVRWVRTSLSPQEVLSVKYADLPEWVSLSCGSRLPTDAAKQINQGVMQTVGPHFAEAAAALRGGTKFPKLILVSEQSKRVRIVLEGHLRLTAFALVPQAIPKSLEVIIGYSESMPQWRFY